MRKAVSLMEQWRRGDTTEFQWTVDLIEQLDPVLRAAKSNLIDGVIELDWDVRMRPDKLLRGAMEKDQAKRQADTLRTEYERIDNLDEAIEHIACATFRGVAHCEIWREKFMGPILHLECVPQWHFHKTTASGEWLYDEHATLGGQGGVPLPSYDWLIREVKSPIAPIALIGYVDKGLTKKDWSDYRAEYGVPPRWAILPTDTPPDLVEYWLGIMADAVSSSFGALPNGADVKIGSVAGGGVAPFREHLDYENEMITLAVLSSSLTMLSKSGTGTLGGNAHADSLQKIIRGLAKKVGIAFQRKIDKDILRRLHPGEPMLAWFSLNYETEASGEDYLKTAESANNLGFQVDPSQVEERTGLKLLDAPALPMSKGFATQQQQELTAALGV